MYVIFNLMITFYGSVALCIFPTAITECTFICGTKVRNFYIPQIMNRFNQRRFQMSSNSRWVPLLVFTAVVI